MRALFAVLLSILLTAPVFAEHLRPFVGVGANINTTNDHFTRCKGPRLESACRNLPDHSGLALQVEGGVTNSTYSAYVGYRSGSSSLTGDDTFNVFKGFSSMKYNSSEITSQHFALGGRVQPTISALPVWLRPMVGVGLTWGHATIKSDWTLSSNFTNASFSQEEELESEDAYGGILEFGFAFRPSNLPLQAFLAYEIHAYEARFSGQYEVENFTYSPTADQYEIRENGFKLGLVYHFKTFDTEE